MIPTQQFEPAYMGEFLKTYKSPLINTNKIINFFRTEPTTFVPSAIITRDVQFPDVSFYQGEVDYSIMSTKTSAIVIRAGQNVWVDEQFERNYHEATASGMFKGIYWFYDDRRSPGEQANVLVSILHGKHIEMEVFIDWENTYGGQFKGLQNVVAMMQAVERAGLDIKGVGLYTGYYWFISNSNAITNANQYAYLKARPLWEAWYTSNPSNVLIPAPWSSLTDWQFGTPVVFWGQQTSELDMNWFNGSQQDFNQRYGGITPPPSGGKMKGLMKNYTVNIRDALNVAVGQLTVNDVVYGPVAIIGGREKIAFSRVYRADGTIQSLGSDCTAVTNDAMTPPLYYMTLTSEQEPVHEKKITKSTVFFDDNTSVDLFPQ
jgi:GH25 family lysozyme M1 (1,4-beta-N-acetylmuramidase)